MKICFRLLFVAGWMTVVAPISRAADPEGKAADPFAEGMRAISRRDAKAALAALTNVPPTHPRFIEAMSLAGERILAESAGRPDLGLPLVERAYRQSPDSLEAAYAYIRVQLLARTNLSVPSIERPRATNVPPEFAFITSGPRFPDDSKSLSRRAMLADLDFLELMLANAYSYVDRRGADWRTALDVLRLSLTNDTPRNTFVLRLHRFLTVFGDPHSQLRVSVREFYPEGSLPFLAVPSGTNVLAVKHDRSGFLDDTCRYVESLDGRPLADWLRVAAYDIPKASPHLFRRSTVGALDHVNYLRTELDLPASSNLTVRLVSADGREHREVKLALPARRVRHGPWPRDPSGITNGIGYLRLHTMDTAARDIAEINRLMDSFRNTRGLVIDVRGNGGGSQDTLRALLPYFLKPGAPMKIINVAAYRLPVKLPQPCPEGYLNLGNRGLHPVTAKVWTPAEREQVRSFLAGFTPATPLPEGKFSDWHVMAIRHETNPKAYHYDRPVVILSDAGCFSATDNFLGAFKGHPNVTILGTTSGGGSGRMAGYTLPNSRLPLTLCQMASLRANGRMFDGIGVETDVVLESRPEDSLRGAGDSVLAAAWARIP